MKNGLFLNGKLIFIYLDGKRENYRVMKFVFGLFVLNNFKKVL